LCQSSDRHPNRQNARRHFSHGRLFKLHGGHRDPSYLVSPRPPLLSFNKKSLTFSPRTVTAYSTVTDTITLPDMKKRLQERQVTVVASSTPGYASACSTPGAYSSACSCWGITATTTFAPTPITTTVRSCSSVASRRVKCLHARRRP